MDEYFEYFHQLILIILFLIFQFSSEERAKEVLQEIIDKIWESSSLRMDIKGINCEVREQTYYMPER